jgi:CDP-6-deoxy-D-xylo-4-hexulose-3-dehydrase
MQHGFVPMPIDIKPELLNSSYDQVVDSIEKNNLKCLFLTNVLGYSSDLPRIKNYCDSNGVLLLEDNCESMGATYNEKQCGTHGLMGSYSSFFSHHMATMEGGCIATDNEELYHVLLCSW